jgi:hypothetical protein
VYPKAYRMFKLDSNQEGIVMTGEVKSENAVAQFRPPVDACVDIEGRPCGDQARPDGGAKRHGTSTTTSINLAIAAVGGSTIKIDDARAHWLRLLRRMPIRENFSYRVVRQAVVQGPSLLRGDLPNGDC